MHVVISHFVLCSRFYFFTYLVSWHLLAGQENNIVKVNPSRGGGM